MHHYIISRLLFFGESGLQNNHKITVTALLSCVAKHTEFSQWLEWLLLRSFNGNEQAKAREHQETQHEQKLRCACQPPATLDGSRMGLIYAIPSKNMQRAVKANATHSPPSPLYV